MFGWIGFGHEKSFVPKGKLINDETVMEKFCMEFSLL
jgi:hypothetical protein